LTYLDFKVELGHINRLLGINIDVEQVGKCASKMGLVMKSSNGTEMVMEVPPTRSDVLHTCDVVEDIGIGFGFNNIERMYPPTNTVGSFQPTNKFADLVRQELAQAGYTEQLTFSLLSLKDNYERMGNAVNLAECVQLENPKTIEFECVRTTLIPGLLKCL
jgi:phenylalanyl-tRNA synthetase beta chain